MSQAAWVPWFHVNTRDVLLYTAWWRPWAALAKTQNMMLSKIPRKPRGLNDFEFVTKSRISIQTCCVSNADSGTVLKRRCHIYVAGPLLCNEKGSVIYFRKSVKAAADQHWHFAWLKLMLIMSEKELGKKWDKCLADGAVKLGKYTRIFHLQWPCNIPAKRGNTQRLLLFPTAVIDWARG